MRFLEIWRLKTSNLPKHGKVFPLVTSEINNRTEKLNYIRYPYMAFMNTSSKSTGPFRSLTIFVVLVYFSIAINYKGFQLWG